MTKRRISIDKISPDPRQPRKTFDEDELAGLAESIRATGLIQPIIVRPAIAGRYVLIAGERRWRAHCLLRDRGHARFAAVEAIVRKNEHLVDVRVKQLVENIQRADMPILEEADALAQLRDEFGLEPDEIASRLGLAPFPLMLDRVKAWLADARDVRIFTARVDGGTVALSMGNKDGESCRDVDAVRGYIHSWCLKHIGSTLPITCTKDYGMIELWDDRCVQVIPNTGRTIADELQSERAALTGKAAMQR